VSVSAARRPNGFIQQGADGEAHCAVNNRSLANQIEFDFNDEVLGCPCESVGRVGHAQELDAICWLGRGSGVLALRRGLLVRSVSAAKVTCHHTIAVIADDDQCARGCGWFHPCPGLGRPCHRMAEPFKETCGSVQRPGVAGLGGTGRVLTDTGGRQPRAFGIKIRIFPNGRWRLPSACGCAAGCYRARTGQATRRARRW
jgi:hypothetical protein